MKPRIKATVFGPTGSTGEQLLWQAFAVGYEVTAAARRPGAVAPIDLRLRVVYGDVVPDPASSLRDGVVGADTVPSFCHLYGRQHGICV